MTVAIKFENVSKQYRLGEVGTGTLSHDLHRAWARMRGRPDPFAKVGQVNNRAEKSDGDGADSKYVWALKDIDFEVEQGEILGIIGRNGAGKSTLLKLLSRVTAPTTGSIKAKGRIASLLEVGTGFHPELTGRENIYLNGAILGMRRHEISKQLDAIVDFSGCAKYVDTPVKRYSSGMTVRLGFSVAAHLDCEILVVDEVLAVGDIEFQKKCIGKMKNISMRNGKTVLFVSHNMVAVENLCTKALTFVNGQVSHFGSVSEATELYADVAGSESQVAWVRVGSQKAALRSISISSDVAEAKPICPWDDIVFQLEIENTLDQSIDCSFGLVIETQNGIRLSNFNTQNKAMSISLNCKQTKAFQLTVPRAPFKPGNYTVGCCIQNQGDVYDQVSECLTFIVHERDIFGTGHAKFSQESVLVLDYSIRECDLHKSRLC